MRLGVLFIFALIFSLEVENSYAASRNKICDAVVKSVQNFKEFLNTDITHFSRELDALQQDSQQFRGKLKRKVLKEVVRLKNEIKSLGNQNTKAPQFVVLEIPGKEQIEKWYQAIPSRRTLLSQLKSAPEHITNLQEFLFGVSIASVTYAVSHNIFYAAIPMMAAGAHLFIKYWAQRDEERDSSVFEAWSTRMTGKNLSQIGVEGLQVSPEKTYKVSIDQWLHFEEGELRLSVVMRVQ